MKLTAWKKRTLIGLAIVLVLVVGLRIVLRDRAPRYNKPLTVQTSPPPDNDPIWMGMWPDKPEQDDTTLMMVAFSGGGSRAAAVGWKTLETLQKVSYPPTAGGPGKESNLAREIDMVAGISGGSFCAAAWCLFGGDLAPFQKRFVERDIQGELAKNLFSGKGVVALFSRRYERINFAAELYDEEVYERKTFADLPTRPILRIHSTDLALGRRFTFTQDTFTRLGSDLNSYPIGYACAASSAFPILLTPLTLCNYGPPLDLSKDVEYVMGKDNARTDLNADLKTKAWEYYNDKSNEYVHLADGGLVDNQGLQSILDEFDTNGIINRRLNHASPPLKRLIIVNVNAGVAEENKSGRSPSAPSVASVIQSTMISSMDVLSARRWMDIQAKCIEVYKAHIDRGATTPSLSQLEEPYRIEVSFRNIRDPELKRQAMALPTSFKLNAEQLALIDKVVPALVTEDPEFQRLQQSLNKPSP
ncbi:MAG TPA: patatin-like phospholipase family protein [Chthoniobacterales bacterium]